MWFSRLLTAMQFGARPWGLFGLLLFCTTCSERPTTTEEFWGTYNIESGFELGLVAKEPMVVAPVAIDFDHRGRVWVAEMPGYMSDLEGDDTQPRGTIKILEDLDGDGQADTAKMFLEHLRFPRALAIVYGGLLYAEPPNLWFVTIENDSPGTRTLVDSLYAPDGNIEHQPNGLLLNIDNWIYNAKSNFRYRKVNGQWIKQPTSFRGQWGITRDDHGRLFYNNNSVQLLGDLVLPNSFIQNPFFTPKNAVNQVLTDDQRVYPIRVSSVNRGYLPNVLDKDSMLVNVTAACGPLIYRGQQFPKTHYQNAFVCIPEANLIKRTVLQFDSWKVTARQARVGEEFLAFDDEGFRPVNLKNGPDGSIYIVDMHRGIIAHKAYTTPYMRQQIESKSLDTLQNMGRIIKVKALDQSSPKIPNLLQASVSELVSLLSSPQGWIRDRAQQVLIEKNEAAAVPLLKSIVRESTDPRTVIHSLYTLEGLQALNLTLLIETLSHEDPWVINHSLMLAGSFAQEQSPDFIKEIEKLLDRQDPHIDLYLAPALKPWLPGLPDSVLHAVQAQYSTYLPSIYREGLLNLYEGREHHILHVPEQDTAMISQIIRHRAKDLKNPIFVKVGPSEDPRTTGLKLFRTYCATCHSLDGNGQKGLAPPLMASEYLSGSSKRLGLILLHGLEGPISVAGKEYVFNNPMPGVAENPELSDEDIVSIIAYIRSAFVTTDEQITRQEVSKLRDLTPPAGRLYRMEDFAERP